MLIIPDKNLAWQKTKILMPVKPFEWRTPSLAQSKNIFGHENQTRFKLTARLNDGYIIWQGWFDDRADADEFLFAMFTGSLQYERALWDLPTPAWRPDFGESLSYEFTTTRVIVSTSSSNQTENKPSDWNNTINTIEIIASGGSGASGCIASGACVTGGGGAAYSKSRNITLSDTITFHLEAGAIGVQQTTTIGNGNLGGDCWYNGNTLAESPVGAKGGGPGQGIASGTAASAPGGAAVDGVGSSLRYSGGASGTAGTVKAVTGGGGAAGFNGNGIFSPNILTQDAGPGGDADNNNIAGGTAGGGNASSSGGNGGGGHEWDATHGSGGGGGGGRKSSGGTIVGGNGGNYGAGSGACWSSTGSATSGNGGSALIWITYTPLRLSGFNMSMLGM